MFSRTDLWTQKFLSLPKRLESTAFILYLLADRAGANHSSALGKIHFQRPLIAYNVILLDQPGHDLFKRKQTHPVCSL